MTRMEPSLSPPSSPPTKLRSISRHHVRTHSMPVSTPQMQVLGRDGRDLSPLWPLHSSTTIDGNNSSGSRPTRALRSTSWGHDARENSSNFTNSSWWDGVTLTATRWSWKNSKNEKQNTVEEELLPNDNDDNNNTASRAADNGETSNAFRERSQLTSYTSLPSTAAENSPSTTASMKPLTLGDNGSQSSSKGLLLSTLDEEQGSAAAAAAVVLQQQDSSPPLSPRDTHPLSLESAASHRRSHNDSISTLPPKPPQTGTSFVTSTSASASTTTSLLRNEKTAKRLSSMTLNSSVFAKTANKKTRKLVEDQVREDCGFFYRDMDDLDPPIQQQSTRAYRRLFPGSASSTMTRPFSFQRTMGELMLPSHHRASYRARYQQLNQAYTTRNGTGAEFLDGHNHDLELSSTEQQPSTLMPSLNAVDDVAPQFPRVADFSNSSLCYQHDGRTLMKLPNDRVRLVMDEELEPGILSAYRVEKTSGGGGGCSSDKERALPQATLGDSSNPIVDDDLYYVLTVPSDLYRNVVREMAHSKGSLYHCCGGADDDDERVSIRVAIFLLVLIFGFLFVNTIIWPVN